MNAGIADTINRQDVQRIARYLDLDDAEHCTEGDRPWYVTGMADTLIGSSSDRAWLVGQIAPAVPGLRFDGQPADCDWENLFAHFRAEILARRDPQTPPAKAPEMRPRGVV